MINLIDYASLIGFALFSYGVFRQIRKTYTSRSSKGIEPWEVSLRVLATIILFVKYIDTRDAYLIIGQTIFLAMMIFYLYLVVKHRNSDPLPAAVGKK